MAEVTEQRAERFAQGHATPLALAVVGFGDIDGNEAVVLEVHLFQSIRVGDREQRGFARIDHDLDTIQLAGQRQGARGRDARQAANATHKERGRRTGSDSGLKAGGIGYRARGKAWNGDRFDPENFAPPVVGHIQFAGFVLPEGGDVEVAVDQQPIIKLRALPADAPDAA